MASKLQGKVCWDSVMHPPFIAVYHPIAGWKAVQMVWVDYDDGEGQYEPWQTGLCGYQNRDAAVASAKSWAEVEGIAYRDLDL